ASNSASMMRGIVEVSAHTRVSARYATASRTPARSKAGRARSEPRVLTSPSAKLERDGNSARAHHAGPRICYVDPRRAHRSAYRNSLPDGGLFARRRGDGGGQLPRLRHAPRREVG